MRSRPTRHVITLTAALVGAMWFSGTAAHAAVKSANVPVIVGSDHVSDVPITFAQKSSHLEQGHGVDGLAWFVLPDAVGACPSSAMQAENSAAVKSNVYGEWHGSVVTGSIRVSEPGGYMLCAYDESTHVTYPGVAFTVRASRARAELILPSRVLSPSVDPQPLTLTVQSEARRQVDMYLNRASVACQITSSANRSVSLRTVLSYETQGGPHTSTRNLSVPGIGAYVFCVYIYGANTGATPDFVVRTMPFRVEVDPGSVTAQEATFKPSCTLKASRVRRGTSVRGRCLRVSGKVQVRFSRRVNKQTVIDHRSTVTVRKRRFSIRIPRNMRRSTYAVTIWKPGTKLASRSLTVQSAET